MKKSEIQETGQYLLSVLLLEQGCREVVQGSGQNFPRGTFDEVIIVKQE
jgi:hypothetical protein